MTIVKILGQEPQEKELKKIKFVKYLDHEFQVNEEGIGSPKSKAEIILLQKNYYDSGLDLMIASLEIGKDYCLYLGHFNDGVV